MCALIPRLIRLRTRSPLDRRLASIDEVSDKRACDVCACTLWYAPFPHVFLIRLSSRPPCRLSVHASYDFPFLACGGPGSAMIPRFAGSVFPFPLVVTGAICFEGFLEERVNSSFIFRTSRSAVHGRCVRDICRCGDRADTRSLHAADLPLRNEVTRFFLIFAA